MTIFLTALTAVSIMLIVAVPGFILKKKNMVSEDCIPGLSKVLLFVCQPCLAVYTFSGVDFSLETLKNIGVFALLVTIIHAIILSAAYIALRRRSKEPVYRIMTIATTFGNCAFFGIPVIEALLPETASSLIMYTTVYAVVMNVLGWTVGSAIISGDSKYISVKKVFLNPAMLSAVLAMVMFVFGIKLPDTVGSMVTTIAKMATPLSMLVMGMRLATVELKYMFSDIRLYLAIAVKQFIMPLIAFLVVFRLPFLDIDMRRTFFIICACPVASIVLNFSEIVGAGQKEGASVVLLGTIVSIVTLPVMMFLLPFIV